MHKNTIDWLKQTNLTADVALGEKRWATAERVSEKLARIRIIELLRLFLFAPTNLDSAQKITDELKVLDVEFPGDSIQELRLMAGFVILTTYANSSPEADVFALGIRAAGFPQGRVQPVQPAMMIEGEEYLREKAGRIRSDEFPNDAAVVTKNLAARRKALADAVAGGDEAKKTATVEAYQKSIVETISDSHTKLSARVAQLAEETALLWWVLNEHSDTLQKPVANLDREEYALAAACEAAKRTHLLPPPPSIGPLLARSLKSCKPGKTRPVFADYLEAAKLNGCIIQMKSPLLADCRDLLPICAALEKMAELGDLDSVLKVIPKLCPGVSGKQPLAPEQAAQQFYNELIFLRALEG